MEKELASQAKKVITEIQNFRNDVFEHFREELEGEIRDWEKIKGIISYFIEYNGSQVILDFIDQSNWDCIEKYEFDDAQRSLFLTWHDFENSKMDEEDRQMLVSTFESHLIECHIKIDSVSIIGNKGFPVLALKGFYHTPKEIQQIYSTRCSKFLHAKDRLFSIDIAKEVKKKIHRIIVPNINIFSMTLVQKCAVQILVNDSKKHLYKLNLKLISDRLVNTAKDIISLEESDFESIKDLGNRARRDFESALKVLNLRNNSEFDKDYQKLMLGDLIGVVEDVELLSKLETSLEHVVEVFNKCSHDSGVYVEKRDVLKSILYAFTLINFQS